MIVSGAVNPSGSVAWGEGFLCERIQKGYYSVQFTSPFDGKPTPVCTIMGPPNKTFNLSIAIFQVEPDSFICATSSPDEPQDCGFTFAVFESAPKV